MDHAARRRPPASQVEIRQAVATAVERQRLSTDGREPVHSVCLPRWPGDAG
jgi:hypothetical protein